VKEVAVWCGWRSLLNRERSGPAQLAVGKRWRGREGRRKTITALRHLHLHADGRIIPLVGREHGTLSLSGAVARCFPEYVEPWRRYTPGKRGVRGRGPKRRDHRGGANWLPITVEFSAGLVAADMGDGAAGSGLHEGAALAARLSRRLKVSTRAGCSKICSGFSKAALAAQSLLWLLKGASLSHSEGVRRGAG